MSQGANVRAIQALEDLRAALIRFGPEAQDALRAMEQEIRRTQEFLAAVEARWRREVRQRKEIVRRASSALARCQASGYRDQDGRYHRPDCRIQEEAVRRARRKLDEAQAKLQEVHELIKLVEKSAQDFQRRKHRLAGLIGETLPKSTSLLEHKIRILSDYTTIGAPAAEHTPMQSDIYTTPPAQAAVDMMTTGALMGSVEEAISVAVLRWLVQDLRHTLGDVGENLSSQLLKERFQWQELPFDQPKHGFDRVFTAPGVPVIIVESKVHQKGKFHPGQTKHGEQGSPEWIAAQVEKMANPDSAQWSPVNERIATLIRKIGPENVPVIAVVIETDSGRSSVFYRQGKKSWQPLHQDIPLDNILTPSSTQSAHIPFPGGQEREASPEMREGGVIGVERRG